MKFVQFNNRRISLEFQVIFRSSSPQPTHTIRLTAGLVHFRSQASGPSIVPVTVTVNGTVLVTGNVTCYAHVATVAPHVQLHFQTYQRLETLHNPSHSWDIITLSTLAWIWVRHTVSSAFPARWLREEGPAVRLVYGEFGRTRPKVE